MMSEGELKKHIFDHFTAKGEDTELNESLNNLRDQGIPPLYNIVDECKADFPNTPLTVDLLTVTLYREDWDKIMAWYKKWFGET